MDRKKAMLALADVAAGALDSLEAAVPADQREAPSTWETWNAVDALYHSADWLDVDFARIDALPATAKTTTRENIDDVNKKIYDRHAGKSWADAKSNYLRVMDELRSRVSAMSEDDLESEIHFDDGSSRTIWRNLAGHAGSHLSWHLEQIMRRSGGHEEAVALEEKMVGTCSELDGDAEWMGTMRYNLACAYALSGKPEKAIEEVGAALELNPGLRDWAGQDDDFVSIRETEEFQKAIGG